MTLAPATGVVAWWAHAGERGEWFAHRPAFDRAFRERYLDLHEQAAAGACEGWIETPQGALALMVLLDQFPRNAFRGTARMYATDARPAPSRVRPKHARIWRNSTPACGCFSLCHSRIQRRLKIRILPSR